MMLSMLDIVYTGAFLYNFTKDINWPKAYMNGDYMFGGVTPTWFLFGMEDRRSP